MSCRAIFAALPVLLGACCAAAAGPPAPVDDGYDFVYLGENRPILMRMHVQVDGRPLQAIWDEFIATVFKDLDVNGDGVLSREEASRTPPPAVLFNNFGFQGLGRMGSVNFTDLDADKDGKVTRAELARYFRTHGAAPFQLGAGNASTTGGIRLVNFGGRQPASPEVTSKRLFELLDTNKDGKLSPQELAAAPAVLRRFDTDEDEIISMDELDPNNIPADDFEAFGAVFIETDMASSSGNGPFVEVHRGEPNQELAHRLLQQYGRKGKGPAVKKLTRTDLGLDEGTFSRLDTDHDGFLDAQELARFGQRPADLELLVALAHAGQVQPSISVVQAKEGPAPLAGNIRRTPGGMLVLELGVTRIEFGNPDQGASSFSVAINVRDQYLQQFKQADRDNNGYLDKDEAKRSPIFGRLFNLMDRDGDGKLFEKEVIAYLDKMEKLQAAALKSCVSISVSPQGSGLFDEIDTNHDHRLSVRELRQMTKLIGKLDRDGDGMVGRDEIPRTFRVSIRPGSSNGNFAGGGTFVVRANGMMRAPAPAADRAVGPVWFRKMDRNHDGDVSRREFLGTDEEFRRIDLDGDGLISPEEADKADKLFRKR